MKNSVLFLLGSIFVTASFTACNAQDDYIEKAPARVETTNTFKARDARVIASGYMTAQFDKRAFTRGNFSANDITITSNAQCPSNFSNLPHAGEINMLALFAHAASQQALVIIPDYEGYGSTASSPHPYCNRELTAEQVVEGAKAGLDYFEKNVKSMEDDWKGCAITPRRDRWRHIVDSQIIKSI